MDIYFGIIFGLLSAIIVALGKVALKKSLNDFPASVSFFLETIFGIVLWIPFAFIFSEINFDSILKILPYVVISAILSEAYIFFIYSKGEINVIGSVFATYSIYTIIFSRLINNEVLNLTTLAFIFITILGTLVIATAKSINITKKSQRISALWALSGAIAVGFSDTISKTAIDETSAGSFLFALALVQIPVALIYLKLERQSPRLLLSLRSEFDKYRFTILAALLIAVSMIFFWLSFQFTFASIASPITATNVMFMVIFAKFFLKEQISRRNYIGVFLILVGIVGVNVF